MYLLARAADFTATGDRYKQLFEALQDMVLMTTPSGDLLEINQTGVETLGYSGKAQIVGIPMKRHYANPSDRRRLISLLDDKGSVKDFEIRFARKDGREIWVWITAHARKDDEGQVVYYKKIIKDVSSRKKLEDQLIEKNRLLERYSQEIRKERDQTLTAVALMKPP